MTLLGDLLEESKDIIVGKIQDNQGKVEKKVVRREQKCSTFVISFSHI